MPNEKENSIRKTTKSTKISPSKLALTSIEVKQEPKREFSTLYSMIIVASCSHGNKVDVPATKSKVGDYMVDTLHDMGCSGIIVRCDYVKD